MNTWRTPERIRRGHSPDQGVDLGVDRRAAAGGPGGELGPVLVEAPPLPPQDGVGSDVTRGRRQSAQTLASATQKSRSVRRSRGRITVRL